MLMPMFPVCWTMYFCTFCCYVIFFLFFFFFFQAEDGIRDKLVTGVQTCALPISSPAGTVACQLQRARSSRSASSRPSSRWSCGRSEERRVGKECRCRWSAYH